MILYMDDKGKLYFSKSRADARSLGGGSVPVEVDTLPPDSIPVRWFFASANARRPELGFLVHEHNEAMATPSMLTGALQGRTFEDYVAAINWRISSLPEHSRLARDIKLDFEHYPQDWKAQMAHFRRTAFPKVCLAFGNVWGSR